MEKIYRKWCNIELIIAEYLLLASVAIIFIAACLRTSGNPIRWGNDIALLLFTWSTFLSADIVFRVKRHVVVDILINKLPPSARKITNMLVHFVLIASIMFLIYFGIIQTYASRARVFQGIPSLSYSAVSSSIPVCFSLMLINEIRHLYYEYIKKTEVEETF